jgi:hypothetical protein
MKVFRATIYTTTDGTSGIEKCEKWFKKDNVVGSITQVLGKVAISEVET